MRLVYQPLGKKVPRENDYRVRVHDVRDSYHIWIARMLWGEGGDHCNINEAGAIMWAITNRYMLHPAQQRWVRLALEFGAVKMTNLDPMEAVSKMFSQPINIRWQKGGDKYEKFKGTQFANPAKDARRKRIFSATLDDIPKQIIEFSDMWMNGELFPPIEIVSMNKPRLSDWASARAMPRTPERFPWGTRIRKPNGKMGANWFFENRALYNGVVIYDS